MGPLSDGEAAGEDPALAPLQVEPRGVYVRGFPLHVAVTVRVARPRTACTRLPVMSLFATHGALGYTLRDAAGFVAYTVEPAPLDLGDDDAFVFALGTGEARRMLVDLSEPLGPARAAALLPGRYQASLVYDAGIERAASPPIGITLRAQTNAETERFEAEAEALHGARSWGRWLHARPARPPAPPAEGPDAERAPLFYEDLVRAVLFGETPGAALAARLRHVTGLYAPEAAAWAAEALLRGGDRAGAALQIAETRRAHPALAWWMDDLEGRSR